MTSRQWFFPFLSLLSLSFNRLYDIALVIPKTEKDAALNFIRERLKKIGLKLNKKKIC